MKVLLDACVPRPLRKFLPDHTVHTAQEMGWGQLKNGALLKEAESQFDAMITTDGPGSQVSTAGHWTQTRDSRLAHE